ncbi:unnamed protein product [Effrenium voratum]|uniref:Uncharacterized protein n=1 Tax=Effrenium voratum TaxID=2562239 RepID=A0AA36HPW2_9DINO|nr:unnamed protein product [Effrenium voratum]
MASEDSKGVEKAAPYDLSGVSESWDDTALVRQRLREGNRVLMHWDGLLHKEVNEYVERTNSNVKLNREILTPLLKLMSQNDQLLPQIDRVMEQMGLLYQKAKVSVSQETIYQESWAIRRLLTTAKSWQYKDHPPKDSELRHMLADLGVNWEVQWPAFANTQADANQGNNLQDQSEQDAQDTPGALPLPDSNSQEAQSTSSNVTASHGQPAVDLQQESQEKLPTTQDELVSGEQPAPVAKEAAVATESKPEQAASPANSASLTADTTSTPMDKRDTTQPSVGVPASNQDALQVVAVSSDEEDESRESLLGRLTGALSQLSLCMEPQDDLKPQPLKETEPAPLGPPTSISEKQLSAPASSGGDNDETQQVISPGKLLSTDLAQNVILKEQQVQDPFPDVPDHPALTRRQQFALKSTKRAGKEKAKLERQEAKETKRGRQKEDPACAAQASSGKRGRAKKASDQGTQDKGNGRQQKRPRTGTPDPAEQKRTKNKGTSKRRRSKTRAVATSASRQHLSRRLRRSMRFAKGLKLARAKLAKAKLAKTKAAQPLRSSTAAHRSSSSGSGPKHPMVTADEDEQLPNQAPKKARANRKVKQEGKGGNTGKCPEAVQQKPKNSRKRNTPKPQPDSSLTLLAKETLEKCNRQNGTGNCEGCEPAALADCYQWSIYWTRQAVGVKVRTDLLGKAKYKQSKKNGKKLLFKQVAYFAGGPCTCVNIALAEKWVDVLKTHGEHPEPGKLKELCKIIKASRTAALSELGIPQKAKKP